MHIYSCGNCGGTLSGPDVYRCPYCGVLLRGTREVTEEEYLRRQRERRRVETILLSLCWYWRFSSAVEQH
jgi:DNA-directed RNA polymerase subunit RPC12/RpoP